MKVCSACYKICEAENTASAVDDEPLILEVTSNCCSEEFIEVTEDSLETFELFMDANDYETDDLSEEDLILYNHITKRYQH